MERKNKKQGIFSIFVAMLFLVMPLANSLSISDLSVTEVSDRYAVVEWDTDEVAVSEIQYGENETSLSKIFFPFLSVVY